MYQNPPPHPGNKLSDGGECAFKIWKGKENCYVTHYLLLFFPEEELYKVGQTSQYNYDGETLIWFRNNLNNVSHFQRLRYRTMEGYMYRWRVKLRDRAMLYAY